jgi:hypothetical protein
MITEFLVSAYSGLELRDLVIRESVRLGDDGDEVNFGVKPTHKFNIEGL